jgi:hypothetical protein
VREAIFSHLNSIVAKRLEEAKQIIATHIYEEIEILDEAPSRNIIRQGRVEKIRRRIRRNTQGRIVVQRNVKRSALKGFRLSGNTVKRIPAMQRIQKTRKLKRYWKTKGKAKLNRTLLKRKMSIRRRTSMGIK